MLPSTRATLKDTPGPVRHERGPWPMPAEYRFAASCEPVTVLGTSSRGAILIADRNGDLRYVEPWRIRLALERAAA